MLVSKVNQIKLPII